MLRDIQDVVLWTVTDLLESIDNYMSLSSEEDKVISRKLCDLNYKLNYKIDLNTELCSHKGTRFKHYWFQKLEYVLWKQWDKSDINIKEFRITSKNSVEHVFPQHHEFINNEQTEKIDSDTLNSFGNLGLLSVSQNSSYSNQDVKKKKIDFDNKNVYDSLKLATIYNTLKEDWMWNKQNIDNHQKEMIAKLEEHYKLGAISNEKTENIS